MKAPRKIAEIPLCGGFFPPSVQLYGYDMGNSYLPPVVSEGEGQRLLEAVMLYDMIWPVRSRCLTTLVIDRPHRYPRFLSPCLEKECPCHYLGSSSLGVSWPGGDSTQASTAH